jgi:hypothetical protein
MCHSIKCKRWRTGCGSVFVLLGVSNSIVRCIRNVSCNNVNDRDVSFDVNSRRLICNILFVFYSVLGEQHIPLLPSFMSQRVIGSKLTPF